MSKTSATELGSFLSWLKERKKKLLWLLGGVIALSSHLFGWVSEVRALLPSGTAQFIASRPALVPALLHVAMILTFLAVLWTQKDRMLRSPRAHAEEIGTATNSRDELLGIWQTLWFAWLALYLALTVRFWRFPDAESGDIAWAFSLATTTLNNAQSAIFFALAWELSELTQTTRRPNDRRHARPLYYFLAGLVLTVLLVQAATRGHVSDKAFTISAGLCAGTSLALFVGRLDSKLLAPPRALLAALYLYACIQSLFGFLFDDYPTLALAMFTLALGLKLVLFVLVYWLFESCRLVYYSHEIRRLMDTRTGDFVAFVRRHFGDATDEQPTTAPPAPGAAPVPVPTGRVFIAAPMSSLPPEPASDVQASVLAIVTELRRGGLDAVEFVSRDSPYDTASQALAESLAAVQESATFVLIYSHAAPSSVLVELGMALALGKPCLAFVQEGVLPPYLVRDLSRRTGCELEYFRNLRELRPVVVRRCRDHALRARPGEAAGRVA